MILNFKRERYKKNYIVISTFLCCISFVFASVSFSQTSEANHNAFSATLFNTFANNSNNNIYSLSLINSKIDQKTKVKTLFGSTYSNNFDNYFTEILTYVNNNYYLSTFEIQNNLESFGQYAICDLYTYSNQVSLKRFETSNINLFKTPNRNEELNTFGNYVDGICYVPDFLADEIISSSQGELKCYNDLIPDLIPKSVEERNKFLDKFSIKIKNQDGEYGRYKIANIFHVKGFSEKYEYNDNNTGKILNDFLSQYIIVANGGKIEGKYKNAILRCYNNKKIINYEQYLQIKSYVNDNDVVHNYYNVGSSTVSLNDACSSKSTELFLYSTNYGIFIPFLILAILFSLSFMLLGVKHISLSHSSISIKKYLLIYILPFFVISLILQILYLTLLKTNFTFLILYNLLFNIFLLIPFIFFLILFISSRRKSHE